jgi:Fe-S-cluster containining protein
VSDQEPASPDEVYQAFADTLDRIARSAPEGAAEVARLRNEIAILVDILVARGALTESHRRLLERAAPGAAPGVRVRLKLHVDKYQTPNSDIDCASLIPLCHARCCSFRFELSAQDVEEGTVRWDLQQPYLIKQEKDRYCTHVDRAKGGGCTIYERRPAPCRTYDCREDRRVWLDFEKRIPAPMEEGVKPLPAV